jgi:hypothetical protein
MLSSVFKSSREGGSESMQLMYLLVDRLGDSQHRSGDGLFRSRRAQRNGIGRCVKRGVKVRMILPGPYNRH